METKEAVSSYEDARKQRLEDNKRRMKELGLADLSKSLSSGFSPASKSPGQPRQVKPRAMRETFVVELRRSSRVAGNPQPDYREVEVDLSLGRRSYSRSCLFARKYASDESRMEAANNAETIMKDLPSTNPSFVKPMLQSHVTGGFWLGLPSMFCKTYLPKRDDMIVLEDEKGEEWETVYLANKTGLSGGWRGFSLDHGLVDGDALVFELVEPLRFKVHIVRANDDKETETGESSPEEAIQTEVTPKKEILEKVSGGPKRKQRLITAEADYKASAKESDVAELKKEAKEEEVSTDKKEINEPGQKRVRFKQDEIDELFEIDGAQQQQQQLTSMLRSKKPSTRSSNKKSVLKAGDAIEVC